MQDAKNSCVEKKSKKRYRAKLTVSIELFAIRRMRSMVEFNGILSVVFAFQASDTLP